MSLTWLMALPFSWEVQTLDQSALETQVILLCLLSLSLFTYVYLFFRPDNLDPALLRPGRLDRKVEFSLPDLESRTQIFKIHTRTMNCERDIRLEF
ncbi:unnamed protein product [Lupinus luteus]|uniref:Uncharacterized protein n=1 Tax=Lupinus luteus TaxID=3873 RepID=A0AAV1YHI1_LUPLU